MENHAVARDPMEIYWKVRAEIRRTNVAVVVLEISVDVVVGTL